jgi:hypothetical protein
MHCPPEIANVLLEILRVGILQIRQAGWQGDSRRCAREADHLHNLPGLLADYSPELLATYYQVEVPAFRSQSTPAALVNFEPLWEQLVPYAAGQSVEPHTRSAASPA